jgi:hypothetical protein
MESHGPGEQRNADGHESSAEDEPFPPPRIIELEPEEITRNDPSPQETRADDE